MGLGQAKDQQRTAVDGQALFELLHIVAFAQPQPATLKAGIASRLVELQNAFRRQTRGDKRRAFRQFEFQIAQVGHVAGREIEPRQFAHRELRSWCRPWLSVAAGRPPVPAT